MSWAEVKKINSDLTTPLNEQLDGVESGLSDEIGAVGTQVEAANEMLEQIDEKLDGMDAVVDAIEDLGTTLDASIRSIDSIKPSLRVTAADAGTITVSDGVHTYTKEMEQPGVAGFILQSLGDFEVTLSDGGQSFKQTVTVTELTVYRATVGFPTLTVTAEAAGSLSVSNGTHTYTHEFEEAGSHTFRLESFGTYTVKLEEGDKEGVRTVEVTEFTDYTSSVNYFSATLKVTALIPSGVGTLKAEAPDGKTYTTECAAGENTITIQAARTYTISVSQNGSDGEIAQTKDITTDGDEYTATAGFISALSHQLTELDWESVNARSHIAINADLSTDWTNIVEVNGKGLFLGAYNHTWYNYTSAGSAVQYQFVIDGTVVDDITIQRSGYDHTNCWGHDFGDGDKKIYAPNEQSWSSSRNISATNTTINSGILGEIGGPARLFERSFVVRAKRAGTTDTSDSIYTFNTAIYRL